MERETKIRVLVNGQHIWVSYPNDPIQAQKLAEAAYGKGSVCGVRSIK